MKKVLDDYSDWVSKIQVKVQVLNDDAAGWGDGKPAIVNFVAKGQYQEWQIGQNRSDKKGRFVNRLVGDKRFVSENGR